MFCAKIVFSFNGSPPFLLEPDTLALELLQLLSHQADAQALMILRPLSISLNCCLEYPAQSATAPCLSPRFSMSLTMFAGTFALNSDTRIITIHLQLRSSISTYVCIIVDYIDFVNRYNYKIFEFFKLLY